MKKLYNDQTGRSMIEMLGVLSIIGVLSVGGIAGYSKAMGKFNLSKATDQISQIVANVRTMYASQKDYDGLTTPVAINLGVAPSEMIDGSTLRNSYEGSVTIEVMDDAAGVVAGDITIDENQGFELAFGGLEREACTVLATQDWGSGTSSGLVRISVGSGSATPTHFVQPNSSNSDGDGLLPIKPDEAATACGNTDNTVTFLYY